jgi:hypothetical protein
LTIQIVGHVLWWTGIVFPLGWFRAPQDHCVLTQMAYVKQDFGGLTYGTTTASCDGMHIPRHIGNSFHVLSMDWFNGQFTGNHGFYH